MAEKTIKIKKALVLFEDEQDAPKNSEREKNKEESYNFITSFL